MLSLQFFPVLYLVFLVTVVALVAGVALAVVEWRERRRMSRSESDGHSVDDEIRWAA